MKQTLIHKAFVEAEHPRDEAGRFAEKGSTSTANEIHYDKEYVLTSTGGKDFGEISPAIAQQIKRQAGKIRLRIGKEVTGEKGNYGQKHIERTARMEQLKKSGYMNARDFVEDIAENFSAIYQGAGSSLILYKRDTAGCAIVVQLEPADQDFYDIKTGMITRKSYLKNKKLLWSKTESSPQEEPSEVRTPHTEQYPSAHSSGSSSSSIPNPTEKSSLKKSSALTVPIADTRDSPVYAALRKRLAQMQLADKQQQSTWEDDMRKAAKRGLNTITVHDVLNKAPYAHTEAMQQELFNELETEQINVTPNARSGAELAPAVLAKAVRQALPKE